MTTARLARGLKGQIADRLRDDILAGRLPAGYPLREIELADRFGTSRGPVREALQQLTHEGVLVAKPNCGVKVAPTAPDSVRDVIVPIRRTIETYAVRLFFEYLTDVDFAKWDEILQRMSIACAKRDLAGIAEQDIALHRSILERAEQPDLLAIWSSIVARVRHHFRESHQHYDDLMDVFREHQSIIAAFRSGDLDLAVQTLEDNIS